MKSFLPISVNIYGSMSTSLSHINFKPDLYVGIEQACVRGVDDQVC